MLENPVGRLLSGAAATLEKSARAWQRQAVDWDMLAEAPPPLPPRMQTTTEREVTVRGRGTFFGKSIRTLTLCPTDMEGWWFERTDLPDCLPVRCSIRNVWTTGNVVSNIVLRSGSPHNYIRMAEHMIALRMGLGIDNLLIKIDSGDPPLFDRGSTELVQALRSAGSRSTTRSQPLVTVREPVTVVSGSGSFLTLAPADPACPRLNIDAAVDFKTAIGKQRIRFAVDPERFAFGATARTNSSALKMLYCRTIGLLFADIRNLGYSLDNLLVAGRFCYWNKPLLKHNGKSLEAVWHRATLDLLAAIALIDEGLFVGDIISYKSGHGLDVEMVQRLYQEGLLQPLAAAK
ncbi:MAG TPA: UDP-3-O-acyl-N-acetylglucosamine deacetylase [Kiritimatiellia bacterium]|jgi:UDP-3-O-acyl-N-acetylglucosamine deacetylase|nr:UDP-3-O-acyl-N-acetylglucosamine deacetylase [Kiritimatiellia bacterium]OQC60383.1 MAG: UDP-3-O-(3-hydroxymyristoyl) N-acetylglucosamine deacetylase [Verrucomicrobia bacterium ADurb.Bin018]MBP9573110.1 UDP-3-O-acyl-N-acetylglucosamine deacetylase [Kiritimatiellia bacterium]HOD99934.1 UDP-3-O-acyl-N-acetylglucosamine deacetylase [Kiritimatiellia bacterium]HOE37162.1 UDP-3-O-acyl-N-acetylglucosamine deacetylase [Kiritimatiellia bacterium]